MSAVSNPYSREILDSVANRIGHDRLLIAHDWSHQRLVEWGADGVGAEACGLIGAPIQRRWLSEPHTLLDAIRRLMDESAESVFLMQQPARWLVRSLFWALEDPSLPGHWLTDDLVRYDPDDPRLLAERMFGGKSTSLAILTAHFNARDPVADRAALLGGESWARMMMGVWTSVLLGHVDHPDNLASQPLPCDLCVSMLADLRADLLGDQRMEQFRAIAHERRARDRDGQVGVAPEGEDGEGIPDIDLAGSVREIVERVERRGDETENEAPEEQGGAS